MIAPRRYPARGQTPSHPCAPTATCPLTPPILQAFIYLASAQLLLSSPPASLLAGGCGLAAGLLYRLDLLGLQRLRLPAALCDLAAATLGRVLVGPGPPQQVFVTPVAGQQQQAAAAAQQGWGAAPGGHGGTAAGAGRGAAAAARAVEPSPEAVQQLVAMGFDEAQATAALRQSGGSVEAALQYLL